MAATLAGAEEYFAPKNHIRAASWARYDPDQKEAAIAQAKRTLNRVCKSDDIEADIDTEAGINPEYAIYEQALHSLMTLPMFNAQGTFASAEKEPANDKPAPEVGPAAVDWLIGYNQAYLSRG